MAMTKINQSTDSLVISAGGYSTRGAKAENQDAFALKINHGVDLELKGHVAVIADGVSSANCAAQASQISVCHFIEEYLATPDSWSVNKGAAQVISSLNNWLYSRQLVSDAEGELEQWFSTFSAIVLKGSHAHLFHVGDCQIAKINGDGYQVLTRDHSTPAGILNRAVGASSHVEVDVSSTRLDVDDVLMLSCDGVHNFVKHQQVTNILAQQSDLERASLAITELAAQQESLDNLTCLLIKVEQLPAQAFKQLVFDRKQQVIPPPLHVGARLDHFEIVDVLEQSARSHVYLAKDPGQDRLVVLKIPSVNFIEDDDYLSAFIREGWVGSQISHPAVMKVYPQELTGKFLYHCCEYVEGQTLAAWIKDNPDPPLVKVRDILQQLVKALRVLQRHDVIHGDIKPDNFIIDHHSRIKLIDFGSCDIGALDEQGTRLNLPQGTLNFTAPELFLGQRANHQSDLYSLAVLVYQMLSNRLPYQEIEHPANAPAQYNLWHYRAIKTYRKDLPDWLDLVLSKALSPNPKYRYANYSELIAGLDFPTKQALIGPAELPLIERDPVKFWQGISGVLLLLLIILLGFG